MKKPRIKMIIHLLLCIVISFAFIYLMVFFGGWKLIESGDPILIEIAVSVIVGILICIIYEFTIHYEARLKNLTDRIQELEKHIENLSEK